MLRSGIFLINIILLFVLISCGPSEKEITNSLGIKFVYIRPGSFMMGIKDEFGIKALHGYKEVKIQKGFYIQTTETTIGQWKQFIKETKYITEAEIEPRSTDPEEIRDRKEIIQLRTYRSSVIRKKFIENYYEKVVDGYSWKKLNVVQTDQHPVTLIIKKDIYAFIKWLNKKEGNFYRLPTEEEWEYAARAGTQTHLPNGDLEKEDFDCSKTILDEIGWYCFNSDNRSHPVAQKKPNPWGLYDMNGNLWENVEENYNVNFNKVNGRILKGGCWSSQSQDCLCGNKSFHGSNKSNNNGFRLVREVEERP